jgi:hypothetical protein
MGVLRLFVVTVLLLVPCSVFAGKKRVMHRYKVVLADNSESVLEGTSMRSNGVNVEILIGKVVDTIITAPKYVTQVTDAPPVEEKPAGILPNLPEEKSKVAEGSR